LYTVVILPYDRFENTYMILKNNNNVLGCKILSREVQPWVPQLFIYLPRK
jgi:hypothetical protein